MLVIGLTGGIGTGKSEVSKLLGALGAEAIDADDVAHQAYAHGTEGWRAIVAAFGEDVLSADGKVDQAKLAAIVFDDREALARLNDIVHPLARSIVEVRLDGLRKGGAKVVVVQAPLLIEADWTSLFDEIWVTTAPDEQVVGRVAERSRLDPDAIRARMRAQMPADERRKHGHVVIENYGTLADLKECVDGLWRNRV